MSFATADERYFVRLVNSTRKELGLDPLKIAKSLNEAADGHTQWMLDTDTFSHTGEGGSRASERIKEAGFPMEGESWGTRDNLGYIEVTGGADLRDEIPILNTSA
jgi:serralysin